MIADYTKDPTLFERYIDLIDEVFPGCRSFALNGMKYKASWPEASIPFIIENGRKIIAHADIFPINSMLNGKEHRGAAIHGVCVKPAYRGKGYFKQLMQKAIDYTQNHFDFSFLFTEKPNLYNHYPYGIKQPEYDFVLNNKIWANTNKPGYNLKALNLNNSDDLNLVHHLFLNRLPLSNQFSLMGKNARTLFILNANSKVLHFLEKLNTLIVFKQTNNILSIEEIVSTQPCQLNDIIKEIPGDFNEVRLQFCPDRFLDEKEYTALAITSTQYLMISKYFSFDGPHFRYPALYWC
jgi:GNAT superfamily N-acetyltransferase